MADSFQADQKQEPCQHTKRCRDWVIQLSQTVYSAVKTAFAMAQPIVRIQVTGFPKALTSGRPEAIERLMPVVHDEWPRLTDWQSVRMWLTYELAKP